MSGILFSKKQLVIISFILALLFHFVFYFNLYGPPIGLFGAQKTYFLAITSAFIMIFVYFTTYWRVDLKGTVIVWVYDLLMLWIFICFGRNIFDESLGSLKDSLFSNYLGLSLFPILFFIVGLNIKYFFTFNKLLSLYFFVAALISIAFIRYPEFHLFILMPVFYIILTLPLRSKWEKVLIMTISLAVLILSISNRAGLLRILISYCIVIAYYVMSNFKISKRLLSFIVFCILLIPVVALYMGINGESIFQMFLTDDEQYYSSLRLNSDTRTFLYVEVFLDLQFNNAFIFGKGLNAGYYSEVFETFSREVVEVGFLQILLKTGIIGFILYISVIVSAIFKALGKSKNLFIKSMGLLLASYVILLFLENIVAYNLLNIIIWVMVGMCHSDKLRQLNDVEIKGLIQRPNKNQTM